MVQSDSVSKLKTSVILLRAAGRLTPRMLLFMVRRIVRNRLAVKCDEVYRRRLAAIEAKLPQIGMPSSISAGLEGMAAFYCVEYREIVDDILLGRVCLHGRTIDFGAIAKIEWNYYLTDEGDHQMWLVKLAHMGFACPMLIDGGDDKNKGVATLIAGALNGPDMTAPGAFSGFWFPYAASHRILSIGSGLMVARANGGLPPETDAAVADFLRLNAAFLLDNIEYELGNNHVERNLAALCLYFSYADSVPPGIAAQLERDIAHLVDRTVLPDGTQVERSPMYQGLTVASLAVMAESPFLSQGLRKLLEVKLKAVRRAFAILCHPDGQVALFNDAWHGEVPRLSGVHAPDGRSLLQHGGYGRLSQGMNLCLMDAGPIGPSWNPGHGHADFLSLEITLGGNRVIVDPGTSRYNTGADRERERSAAAHNGPIWRGHEPVEFLGCFKVGRLAEAQLVAERFLLPDTIAGLLRGGPGIMGRMVRHYHGQGYLVADLWTPQAPGQVTWLIPASWKIFAKGTGFALHDIVQDKHAFIAPLSPIDSAAPIRSHWARYYGHLEDAHALCFSPKQSAGPQTLLTWIGHVAAPETAEEDGATLLGQLETLCNIA